MNDTRGPNELTADETERLRRSLIELRDELQGLLAATREGVRPVDLDEPIGRLTRMDAIQQQSMTAAGRRGYDLRLRQVLQALDFMDRGRYGLCGRCGDPIGFRRLAARAESPYCLECQEAVDRRHS